LVRNCGERDHFADIDVDGRILLNYILKKLVLMRELG
jgi:hypothetical protein